MPACPLTAAKPKKTTAAPRATLGVMKKAQGARSASVPATVETVAEYSSTGGRNKASIG
jgi:hypothetical protein